MRVVVITNDRAGTGDAASAQPTDEAVHEALESVQVHPEIRRVSAEAVAQAAKSAAAESGIEAVVAGGGDGTLSAVAGVLAGGSMPLGILPLGTLNHFAKDNGIPMDVQGAAAVIAGRRVERLDVGRVNGRVFINNSSVGVYARALVDRDVRRDLHGLSKWPAMALAVLKVFRQHPLTRVRINADERGLISQDAAGVRRQQSL